MAVLELFRQSGIASTILFVSIVVIAGLFIGKIEIFKVKVGITGVLFAGLLVGHLGASPDSTLLSFLKEFGLILFVYSIGLDVGPRFFSSFKNNGLKINMLASLIVVLGTILAGVIKVFFDLPVGVASGILCGGVTNTPSLGAVQQVLTEQLPGEVGKSSAALSGMAYAVAYPLGVLGGILTMLFIKVVFKISIKVESNKYTEEVAGLSDTLDAINIKVSNAMIENKTFNDLTTTLQGKFVMSRVFRNDDFFLPTEEDRVKIGDILYGVSTKKFFDELNMSVGPITETGDIEVTGSLGMRHVVVTNKCISGKTIKRIGLERRFPVHITRIFRASMDILPKADDTVEFGDTVRLVGDKKFLNDAASYLGNSVKDLSAPNVIPIFIGMMIGILLGSIPILIPGLPAPTKLGFAGGPLIVALFLGHKGRIGKLDFYMTPGANLFVRELGIVLFFSAVGITSGKNFISTILGGGYVWILYGAIITIVPLIIVSVIARKLKLNYLTICGIIAGSMTDPPALEFANSLSKDRAQATAYATVYPLTMFLRVLLAQVLVIVLM